MPVTFFSLNNGNSLLLSWCNQRGRVFPLRHRKRLHSSPGLLFWRQGKFEKYLEPMPIWSRLPIMNNLRIHEQFSIDFHWLACGFWIIWLLGRHATITKEIHQKSACPLIDLPIELRIISIMYYLGWSELKMPIPWCTIASLRCLGKSRKAKETIDNQIRQMWSKTLGSPTQGWWARRLG